MTSETQNGQQQPAEVGESTTLLVVDAPSSQFNIQNQTAAAVNEVPAAQEAAITSTSGNNGVSEEESIVPQPHDSDEDGEHPTVSVVIDEDEDGAGEEGRAVAPSGDPPGGAAAEPEGHFFSLPYQDHNYDMGRPTVRSNSSRDNNEAFPVIEGLSSYIGDELEQCNNTGGARMAAVEYRRVRGRDSVSSSSVDQMRIHHGFHPTVISTNHHHSGVVASSRQYGGQNVVRTIRGADGYSPSANNLHPGTRQVSIVGGQLPAVFNPRRVVRPSTISDYGQGPPTLRASRPAADGVGYAAVPTRYTTLTPQNHRGIGTSPITNLTSSTTAAVMNDPSRAANDNAPAPFFIPSRGVKPFSRNRISTPGRGPPLTGGAGMSPAPSTGFQQSIQGSPRKVCQQVSRGGRASENTANDMHTYVKRNLPQETLPDTSAIDVVEEEEAQNAKFFQRQSQSLGATIRSKQMVQYPAGQEPVKQNASPRENENLSTPVHLQQKSSPNNIHNNVQPASFRGIQQSAVPSILQRGTRQLGTTPPEAINQRLSSSQDQAYSQADQQSLTALKQAQRPRGRPRGQRNSEASGNRSDSAGSPRGPLSPAETKRQRLQQQQQQPFSNSANQAGIQGSSSTGNYIQAAGPDYNNHQQQTQRVISQQYPMGYAQTNPNGTMVMPHINEMHQQQSPNKNFMHRQRDQLAIHQQAGSEHQYHQRLEDLAEVAQRSSNAQHPNFTPTTSTSQRPIYPIPVTSPPMYSTRSPKNQQQQAGHMQQQFHSMEHTQMPSEHLITGDSSPYKTYSQSHQFYSSPLDEHNQLQNYSANIPQMHNQQPQFMAAAPGAPTPFASSDQSIGQLTSFDSFSEQSTQGGVLPTAKQHTKKRLRKGKAATGAKFTTSKTNASVTKEDEWEGEDYVTRCFCGMTHNDDFMIECDRCNVWQHGVCLGINPKNVPDCYFCELCNQRTLKHTKEQAIAIQEKKLAQQKRITEKLKLKGGKKAVPARKAPPKSSKGLSIAPSRSGIEVVTAKKQSGLHSTAGPMHSCKKFVEITENQYSRGVRAFVQQTNDKGQPNLLLPLRTSSFARQMFVAAGVEGLVATLDVEAGHPVIEYSGCFSLASEAGNKDKLPNKHSFTLNYCGFTNNGQVPTNRLFIDASKIGSAARFARRSCKPNTQFQHAIDDGKLHVVLVATENIDFSAEVTIPFDYDYKTSLVPVNCACSVADLLSDQEEDCQVRKFNRSLISSPKSPSQPSKMLSSARQSSFSPTSPAAKGFGLGPRLSSASSIEGSISSPKASPKKEVVLKKKKFVSKKGGVVKKHKVKGFNFKKKKALLKASKSEHHSKARDSTGSNSSKPRRSGRMITPATTLTQTNSSASLSLSTGPEPVDVKKHDKLAILQVAEGSSGNTRKRTASQTSTSFSTALRTSNRLQAAVVKAELKVEEPIKSESPEKVVDSTARSLRTKTKSMENTEEEQKKEVPSSEEKGKLSREERKLQETLAAIDRQEQREKQKQEKKDKFNDVKLDTYSKKFKPKSLAEILKNKSSNSAFKTASNQKKRSLTPASALSSSRKLKDEDIGRKDKQTRDLAVTPITGNKLYKKSSAGQSSFNNNEKEESPVRKKTRASIQQLSTPQRSQDKQLLSSVEAAELLTEMASGIGNSSAAEVHTPKKTVDSIDIHSRLVELAQIALEQSSQKKTDQISLSSQKEQVIEFCLGPDYPSLSPPARPVSPPLPPPVEELKEPSPSAELTSKPNTKAVKKLTIDEYKRRRSQAADASSSTPTSSSPKSTGSILKASPVKKPSFIPLLTSASIISQPLKEEVLRSPPLTADLAAPSLDELKRRIYGAKPEKVSPAIQQAAASKPVSQPRVSLEERLRSKFGVSVDETSSSSSRTAVPATPPCTPVDMQPPPPPPSRLFIAPPPPPPPAPGRATKPTTYSSSSSGRW